MKNIVWFNDVHLKDIGLVGGKGANLGEMYNIKLPIPHGFIVTAKAYKKFIVETGIENHINSLLENIDINDSDDIGERAFKIQEIILETEIPFEIIKEIKEAYANLDVNIDVYKMANKETLKMIKAGRDLPYVAVRSSATAEDLPEASFAGQQETYLNVRGQDNVIKSVQKCWASLFTPRAIYYREKNNFPHEKVLIAVIIHKMVNGDQSGVMFTINPGTNEEDEIVIEACYGLGEALVSGQINPDKYVVSKSSLEIIDKNIRRKNWMLTRDDNLGKTVKKILNEEEANSQVINDKSIVELAKYGISIEKHYKKPMDIEFGVINGKIYILQARPVTTQAKVEEKRIEKLGAVGNILLEGLAASPGVATGNVKIVHELEDLRKVKKGDILVAVMTKPDYVVAMERAAAIITNEGGITSHAAIVSRELGIPAVVGTEKATYELKDEQLVTVDGTGGKVYAGDVEIKEEHITEEDIEEASKLKTKTRIYMNLGEPEKIDAYNNLPFDGIGLLRLEFMISDKVRAHPNYLIKEGRQDEYVNALKEGILKVAEAVNPKPVIVRFSDFKTNEYHDLEGGSEYEEEESNPMMGWRGVSRYVDEDFVEAFKLEIRAIKEAREVSNNIHVMLPFVRTTEEVEKCIGIMNDGGLYRQDDFEIYLMGEVPSITLIAEDFAKLDIDGVSIGSNDLTQLILGVDRDSAKLGKLGYFDERNKAVLKGIYNIIKGFKENGKKVSICGQAPSVYPEIVEFLVKYKVDSISVNPDSVVKVRKHVYEVESKKEIEFE